MRKIKKLLSTLLVLALVGNSKTKSDAGGRSERQPEGYAVCNSYGKTKSDAETNQSTGEQLESNIICESITENRCSCQAEVNETQNRQAFRKQAVCMLDRADGSKRISASVCTK